MNARLFSAATAAAVATISLVSPFVALGTAAAQVAADEDHKLLAQARAKAKAAQDAVEKIAARIQLKKSMQTSTVAIAEPKKSPFESDVEKLNRQSGKPLKPAPDAPDPDNCNPQRLYIRADRLDNFLYPQTIDSAADAVGAAITYTDDRVSGQRSLSVNGQVSYVLFRNLCPDMATPLVSFLSGWVIAPWISGNGNYTSPRSTKEESSAKVGVDLQAEVSFGIPFLNYFPLRQVFAASPYYQTDFRGEANISGLTLSWTPYDARYHIGGYLRDNPYLGWFLQLSAEADIRNVQNPGVTGIGETSYSWVGGVARLSLFFLPFADVSPVIRNRLSFVTTGWFYHDLRTGIDAHKYSALLKYKIVPEGYSSIAFEYSRGTDKDTLVFADKYLAKLLVTY